MKIHTILMMLVAVAILTGTITNAAAADDPADPNIPAPYNGPIYYSPSWESIVDNGGGIFTFTQGINAGSSIPHYDSTLSSGGFGIYSWYGENYGWQHSFPYAPGMNIISSTLDIKAWDVDFSSGERDEITGDGVYLNPQYLQGSNNAWSSTIFDVQPTSLNDGILNMFIYIDVVTQGNWATTLEYSELTVVYSMSGNQNPYQPTASALPVCPTNDDDLVVTVTGPSLADPDGDPVTYEYRWFVDAGLGLGYEDDESAGRGDHIGNTIPASDTQNGDTWRVQVTAVDSHGSISDFATVDFAEVGGPCQQIPEFPSIALPIMSIIGMMFLVSRRNKGSL